jgi:hypothetical protein
MAQIAIPLVIAGVLYLASNENKDKECFQEYDASNDTSFTSTDKNTALSNYKNQTNNTSYTLKDKAALENFNEQNKNVNSNYKNIKQKEDITVLNNIDRTQLNTNDKGVYSQYQDKYMNQPPKEGEFMSLTGEKINGIKHNNMNVYYNNKSNGLYTQPNFNNLNENRLDNYTGMGTHTIEKSEISSLFKPQENIQNVYGSQNQSEFLHSRVNESLRHANTKPWEEVREAPGSTGFNTAVENRDKWMPKKVDDLRVATNPKSNYELNYVAPAFKMGDHAQIGKMIQKGPEKYHVNGINSMGGAQGASRPTQMSEQMLTDENREHTSVAYYGGRNVDSAGYVKGKYEDAHKTQLPANPYLNLTSNNVFPTNEQNYGKNTYKSYTNNRDVSGEYFGAVRGLFMANVVNPIVNGLKHTKKTNFVENSNPSGFMSGNKKHTIQNDIAPAPTNRQMQEDRVGLNYLQINRFNDPNGYLTANPYLIGTQRESTTYSNIGNARGLPNTKSYQAEYNQREYEKPSENRIASGNTNVFNNVMNVNITKSEQSNDRTQLVYIPTVPQINHLGNNTTQKQEYKNISDDYLQADLLKAFKQNPYTKPIGSVA